MSTKSRWAIYIFFIAAVTLLMVGRIFQLSAPREGLPPFHSANDRSRWVTVRALGDLNTYEIDRCSDLGWNTIDKVQHRSHRDKRLHFYSSKPPLLATIVAYEYLAIKSVTGKSIVDDPFPVTYIVLITFNVVPIIVICTLIALMAERYCETDRGKILVVAAACFGTYLLTFSNTLNNHIPAALGVAVAIYALARIWNDQDRRWVTFFIAGLGGAWAAANELPALSLLALVLVVTMIKSPSRAIVGTLIGAGVVAASFFCTNYIAHGTWSPPYAHRNEGPIIAELDSTNVDELDQLFERIKGQRYPDGRVVKEIPLSQTPDALRAAIADHANSITQMFLIEDDFTRRPAANNSRRWVVHDIGEFVNPVDDGYVYSIAIEENKLKIREWANWYAYPNSYWFPANRSGIDQGEPSRAMYAFHCLIGHHGIFVLTPIWILALIGAVYTLARREHSLFLFVLAFVAISIVVVLFYIARDQGDRNYGGMTCTLRWLLWLAPLWLVMIIPVADAATKNMFSHLLCWGLIFLSFVSAMYAFSNPWQLPWTYSLGF